MAKERQQNLLDRTIDSLLDQLSPDGKRTRPAPEGEFLVELLHKKEGWRDFLQTVGPGTFGSPFSFFHEDFWNWYWRLTKMRFDGDPLAEEQLTYLALWGRGAAKSSSIEWAAIVEGSMGLKGYVLYVCSTQATANEHMLSIRRRLETDEISMFFPHLASPLIGTHGNRYGWRQEFLITQGGWAIRPVGLDVAVRGLKVGDLRPTLMIFDDVDSHKDTPATVADKIDTISREIVPAGTEDTIKLFGQNVIHEGSIANKIRTGKTDILNNARLSFVPSFDPDTLDIETAIDKDSGKTRHVIQKADPTWEHLDVTAAQRFLDDSGLFSFFAEYQHDFTLDAQDKVLPEYDDLIHVITWSQFEEKYGVRNTVPKHWQRGIGLDLGYSGTHLSAWTWIAAGAQDSGLPNCHFVYRGRCFTGVDITEQADVVSTLMKVPTNKQATAFINEFTLGYSVQRMSHEKLGEKNLLNRQYKWSFSPAKSGKEDGLPEWRNLLRVDKSQPHPFHTDRFDEDNGKWSLGRPNFFFVVADNEQYQPTTDSGLAIHRAQALNWRRRKVTLSVTGQSREDPMKIDDDANDSVRMVLAERSLNSTPKTAYQTAEEKMVQGLKLSSLEDKIGMEDYGGILLHRQMVIKEVLDKEKNRHKDILDALTKGQFRPRNRRRLKA